MIKKIIKKHGREKTFMFVVYEEIVVPWLWS